MIDIQRSLLYIITLHFLFGVFLQSIIQVELTIVGWLFLIGVGCSLWSRYIQAHTIQQMICTACVSLSAGMCSYAYYEYSLTISPLHSYHNKIIELQGTISKDPTVTPYSQKIIFKGNLVSSTTIARQEKVIAYVPLQKRYSYGDELVIQGKLTQPTNFINEIGREVDYIHMLQKDGIQYEMKKAIVISHTQNNSTSVTLLLYKIKKGLIIKLQELLPEPDASLAAGMLLGEKNSLGDELTSQLRDVGLIHIVVLSGYNIAIIALVLERIGKRFSTFFSHVFIVVGIILFVIMVGGGATVIRAAIMALLAVSTQMFGRSYDAGRALWAAALVMVAINPYILLYGMSFQLSFLATLGIVYATPILENYWKSERFLFLKIIIITTVSTQLLVAPFLVYATGSISLVGLITNILVVPLTPFIMATSFITAMTGFIHPIIAFPFAYITHILFSYMQFVIHYFAALPFASLHQVILSKWGVVTIYGVYTMIGLFWYKYVYHSSNKI